jgi:hypothetical protein
MHYEIKNTVGYRRKDRQIVLTPFRNLVERGSYIEPEVLVGSYRYAWGKILNYFFSELQVGMKRDRNGLPMHFGVELIDKDYAIMVGQPLTVPSYWMGALADEGVVPYELREAIVVCMVEDFTVDIPEERMLQMMAHQLITPMMAKLDVPINRVVMIDEIIAWDRFRAAVKAESLPYDRMVPSTYWDRAQLEFAIQKFKKYV